MQKVTRFMTIILGVALILAFTAPAKTKINWISFAELAKQYAVNPKPIIIDVYTDWCGWCKEMDRTTYKNKKLADYINKNYYAVKYDAESKETVVFNGKPYGYNEQTQSNELANFLLMRRLEFPTTVFLPKVDAKPAPLPGFYTAKEMEAPLRFFGEGHHRSKSFVEFNEQFKGEW